MSWREIMKSESHTQYSQNTQNHPENSSSENIEDIEHRSKIQKAMGKGCGDCGNRLYNAIQVWTSKDMPKSSPWSHEHIIKQHWQCRHCKAIYEIIGGTKGALYIN